jgi:hypothetical protein
MPLPEIDETRATARLPHVDIDIVHRQSDDAELLTITLQAVPSFRAFEQFLEAANPFQFWMRVTAMAWQPWLAVLPRSDTPRQLTPHKRDED